MVSCYLKYVDIVGALG